MLKGIKNGVIIEITEIGKDIKELREKLENDEFFGKNMDFYILEKNKRYYSKLSSVLQQRGHNLYLIKDPEEKKEELKQFEEKLEKEYKEKYEAKIQKFYKENEKKFKENEDIKIIKKTLRSGRRVETKGNVLIIGDVNPGSEVFADGDVYIFGRARGIVHAGRSGDKTRTILALSMEMNQIRIANVFANGEGRKPGDRTSERAFIDEHDNLVIEEFKIF